MNLIYYILIVYLLMAGLYLCLAWALGHLYKMPPKQLESNASFLIVIPAYQEDAVILHSTQKALRQQYAKDLFDVLVLADGLLPETVIQLRAMGAQVLQLQFSESTKLKSLKSGVNYFQHQRDYVILLDADNHMDISLLTDLKDYLNTEEPRVLQLNRAAKNLEQGLSYLDAFSEFANEHLLCKAPNAIRLSSKLSGSGMVFPTEIYNYFVQNIEAIGGFDKAMELAMTKKGIKLQFMQNLCVYDEKVEDSKVLGKQRGRWIYAQYYFFKKSFIDAVFALRQGNFDYFHKSAQLALPPRVLALFLLIVLHASTMIFNINAQVVWWLNFATILFLVPYILLFLSFRAKHKVPSTLWSGVLNLLIGYVSAIGMLHTAKGKFLHTTHKVN